MNIRHTVMTIEEIKATVANQLDLQNKPENRFIYQLLDVAICGHMDVETKKDYLEDLFNRGIIARPQL